MSFLVDNINMGYAKYTRQFLYHQTLVEVLHISLLNHLLRFQLI